VLSAAEYASALFIDTVVGLCVGRAWGPCCCTIGLAHRGGLTVGGGAKGRVSVGNRWIVRQVEGAINAAARCFVRDVTAPAVWLADDGGDSGVLLRRMYRVGHLGPRARLLHDHHAARSCSGEASSYSLNPWTAWVMVGPRCSMPSRWLVSPKQVWDERRPPSATRRSCEQARGPAVQTVVLRRTHIWLDASQNALYARSRTTHGLLSVQEL